MSTTEKRVRMPVAGVLSIPVAAVVLLSLDRLMSSTWEAPATHRWVVTISAGLCLLLGLTTARAGLRERRRSPSWGWVPRRFRTSCSPQGWPASSTHPRP